MTVIDGIEIVCLYYKMNDIKFSIKNNEPIEDKLHVIIIISNPCFYKRRYILINEFVKRIEEEEENVELYIVEMVYGDNNYQITDSKNPRHLQLRTQYPLWHKENMINLGIEKLLPKDWKYVAWIDSDIEFDSRHWVEDAKYLLYHKYDIVQLFSIALDLNKDGQAMNTFQSFGYKFVEGHENKFIKNLNYWHPGYAWACTKDYYNMIGKLYDIDILGSADYRMAMAFLNKISYNFSDNYNSVLDNWIKNLPVNLKLGYIPGVIRHYYHGSKINRKYVERNDILKKYNYDPINFITYNSSGIIIPTSSFPKELLDDILQYFSERKEDD